VIPILNEPEQWLIEFLRRESQACPQLTIQPGAHYPCLAQLFLDRGRLFAPASSPTGTEKHDSKSHMDTASSMSSSSANLYVEGWVWGIRRPLLRSWCGTVDGIVRRDSAPCSPARAYLGLPFSIEAATAFVAKQGAILFHADGTPTPRATRWLQDGIPAGVLEEVGRPVPGGVEGLPELELQ
jgi:hypothetical protein